MYIETTWDKISKNGKLSQKVPENINDNELYIWRWIAFHKTNNDQITDLLANQPINSDFDIIVPDDYYNIPPTEYYNKFVNDLKNWTLYKRREYYIKNVLHEIIKYILITKFRLTSTYPNKCTWEER